MKKTLIILAAILLLLSSAISANAKTPAPKTYSGYLMDKMCAKRKAGDLDKMKNHSLTCLTEDGCADSGFGVVVGKKFIPFDAKGNELTANYLKTTTKEKDFQVVVTGVMKKNKIAVATFAEKQN